MEGCSESGEAWSWVGRKRLLGKKTGHKLSKRAGRRERQR